MSTKNGVRQQSYGIFSSVPCLRRKEVHQTPRVAKRGWLQAAGRLLETRTIMQIAVVREPEAASADGTFAAHQVFHQGRIHHGIILAAV